ncbi:flagellar hook capping FlgD N-terminal domain-containing protein [Marivita sp.]|uniref:flagellar hook capping FlgD N-terminal domain-containing protein n=1 Tax=Marivita sp. TaxID=2003365 RepID=UPI003A882806
MDVASIMGGNSGTSQAQISNVSQDFETFLRMLTTQIQNQDPLSPMAADQFASQLASFSMVEQQTLTNQKLDILASAFGAGGITAYASVVGRFALHEGPFDFTGAEITLEIADITEFDGDVKLVILDSRGAVVSEAALAAGQSRVTWNGTDFEGRIVAPATYTAEIRRVADETNIDVRIATGDLVEEVRFGATQVELLLANGTVVPETAITTLR